jgi:hypothetical protein
VFVGQIGAIATAETIDFADEAESGAGEIEIDGVAFFIGLESGVKLPAGEDAIIGDADLLDLFEIEQARTVGESVKSHDAESRLLRIDDVQGDHQVVSREFDRTESERKNRELIQGTDLRSRC